MYDLIDIGANLTHDSFDRDRPDVIRQARDAGVRRIIVTGASAEGSTAALALCQEADGALFATAGVHPHHATELDVATADLIRKLATQTEVVAVGECGLDYYRNFSPHAAQQHAFAVQLDIACEISKVVFLHQRDAHLDFLQLLKPRMQTLQGGVAHCFTGDYQQMKQYLDLGLYIGITGWICDDRRGEALREAVPKLPLDRLLLETDAPYLLPRDLPWKMPGRRNVPAVLPHVLEATARLMRQDIENVAVASTANAERLFGLPA